MEITVRDLMNQKPATISINASIDDAVVAMFNQGVSELYVVDVDDQLVGIVPDYELLKLYLNGLAKDQSLVSIASSNITTIQPGYSIMQVSPLFRNSYLDRLAVVENGRLIGVLKRLDVIWLLSTVNRVLQGEAAHAREIQNGENTDTPATPREPVASPKFLRQRARKGTPNMR